MVAGSYTCYGVVLSVNCYQVVLAVNTAAVPLKRSLVLYVTQPLMRKCGREVGKLVLP